MIRAALACVALLLVAGCTMTLSQQMCRNCQNVPSTQPAAPAPKEGTPDIDLIMPKDTTEAELNIGIKAKETKKKKKK